MNYILEGDYNFNNLLLKALCENSVINDNENLCLISNKILENDSFNILGLESFNASDNLILELIHSDKNKEIIKVCHSYNANQIEWFKAGSSLNLIASKK